MPINLPSRLQFHCITWRIKPFPSCTVSRSPEQWEGGLGWCSAAPALARRFAQENMTGFVPFHSLADIVSAPAHHLQTQTHGEVQTSAASWGSQG